MAREAKHMTDTELSAALRSLALRSSPEEVDLELLEDYLDGTVTPEDRERITQLLAQSGELREELVGLAAIARGTLKFQTLPRPVVPKRRRKRRPSRTIQLLMGLAAVLAVAIGLARGVRHPSGEALSFVADTPYYGEQFQVDAVRGSKATQTRPPQDFREAALLAFRQRLRWTEGGIVVEGEPVPPATTQGGRTVSFRTEGGGTYQASIPPEASDCRLAILKLPALTLSWGELPAEGDRFQIRTPVGSETSGRTFLAVTYRTPSGFEAVLAAPR